MTDAKPAGAAPGPSDAGQREAPCEVCGKCHGHHHADFDGFVCETCRLSWSEKRTTLLPHDDYDDQDMANVGRAFMEAIEQARKADAWVKDWAPAQCPSEIIFDLLNHFDGVAQGTPEPVQAAGFAELADIITKIDILLARTDETAGYAAFVKMRQAWPKLRVAALRGCSDEESSITSAPAQKSLKREEIARAIYDAASDWLARGGMPTHMLCKYDDLTGRDLHLHLAYADAVLALMPAQAVPKQEPVQWQWRMDNDNWCPCEAPDADELRERPEQFRPLYTSPPPSPTAPAQADVDRAELVGFLQDLGSVTLMAPANLRQAERMADALIARGLVLSSTEGASK